MKHRLFVYGTLGPGEPNQHVLVDIGGSWSEGCVRGRLVSVGWGAALGYPAIELDASADCVQGYVFESEGLAAHWAALDAFEGQEYRRVRTEVETLDGDTVDAHIYVSRSSSSDTD